MNGAVGSEIDRPVFLVGAERSGTTVLRLMLDHHPLIAWESEFEYAVDFCGDDGWPNLEQYYEWLAMNRIFRASGFEIDRTLCYPDLIRDFLSQARRRRGAGVRIVGATCHRHFDRLLKIWPAARFIHIVRDGRDVALSNIVMGWAGNVYTGVERWIDAERLWTRLQERLASDRYIEVKQEDLIRSTAPTLTHICGFLGAAYDPKMLDYPNDSTYKAPDPTLVEQWRRKASEDQVRLVESRIDDMLLDRGYELSGLPHMAITPSVQRRLRRQDRWARILFRQRRYGLRLWLEQAMSRRLHMRSWHKNTLFRTDEIDTRHLK